MVDHLQESGRRATRTLFCEFNYSSPSRLSLGRRQVITIPPALQQLLLHFTSHKNHKPASLVENLSKLPYACLFGGSLLFLFLPASSALFACIRYD